MNEEPKAIVIRYAGGGQPLVIAAIANLCTIDIPERAEQMQEDAAALEESLWEHLPAGTYDELYVRMVVRLDREGR